jgi:hypothetical protein
LTILISFHVILIGTFHGVSATVDITSDSPVVNKGLIITDPNLKAELIFHGSEPPRDGGDHSSVT